MDVAVGRIGFEIVTRKCEPWTLAWDMLILLNTAIIFLQNAKLSWLVPCSPASNAFEWVSLGFLTLFVIELAIELFANGVRYVHRQLHVIIIITSIIISCVCVFTDVFDWSSRTFLYKRRTYLLPSLLILTLFLYLPYF